MTPRISVAEGNYELGIGEVQAQIEQFQQTQHQVTTPEELEALEVEIRQLTNQLAAVMLGDKLQQALDTPEIEEAEKKRWRACPTS